MFLSFSFPPSLPPASVSFFSPAVVCQPQQHALFRTHDLTKWGEGGSPNYSLALVYTWGSEGMLEWLTYNIQTPHLSSPSQPSNLCRYNPSSLIPGPCNSLFCFYEVSHCEGMSSSRAAMPPLYSKTMRAEEGDGAHSEECECTATVFLSPLSLLSSVRLTSPSVVAIVENSQAPFIICIPIPNIRCCRGCLWRAIFNKTTWEWGRRSMRVEREK